MRLHTLVAGLLVATSVTGCRNPADDVPAATVGAEQPAESNEAATTADNAGEAPATGETATPAHDPIVYTFDGQNSAISFVASKVTRSHDGGFRDFAGTVTCQTPDPTSCEVELTIQMRSTYTDTDRLTSHLMDTDFFNVEAYPTATFRTTAIVREEEKPVEVMGNLTLLEATKSLSFPAELEIVDDGFSLNAEFSINRQEWGIAYAGMADDLIRDEVILRLEIKGSR